MHMVDVIATALTAPFRSFSEATEVLSETARRSNVAHLSYWFLEYEGSEVCDQYWVSTYDPRYMDAYMKNCTPMGDPVFERLLAGEDHVDWLDHALTESEVAIRGEAIRSGIAPNGLSLGFKPMTNSLVAFSVNLARHDEIWNTQKSVLVDRFNYFSRTFHKRMEPLLRCRRVGNVMMAI
jgi:hypothetical protein